MEFGISSYSFPWAIGVSDQKPAYPMSCLQLLWEADRLQAKRLQLADNLPAHLLSAGQWQELCEESIRLGIQLELGIRGLKTSKLRTYLRLSQDCGSPFIRVVIDEADFVPDHQEIIHIIQNVLPEFRSNKIKLAIENHDRFRAQELVDMITTTDPEWVGICLDTANSLGADEGIYEVSRILAPYTFNLHVKDYRIRRLGHQMGFSVTGTPAGQGQTPVAWILKEVMKYRKCQSATLEVWSEPLDELEATISQEYNWVEQGATFLRPLLQSLQQKQV